MDEVDAKLVEKAKAFFTSHYPDVLARLEKLPGRYRAWIPYKKFRENRKKGEPPSLHLWLCYFVESRGGFYVRIRVYLDEVSPDVWKNVGYCYHFGSNQFTGDDREGVIGEERWGGSTAHVKARITSAPSCPVQRALDDLIAAHNALGAPGMKP